MEFRKSNICKCSCHQMGTKTMHMMACCHLCYKEYLNENKKVIPEEYNKVVDSVKAEYEKEFSGKRQVEYFKRNNYFAHYEDLKD